MLGVGCCQIIYSVCCSLWGKSQEREELQVNCRTYCHRNGIVTYPCILRISQPQSSTASKMFTFSSSYPRVGRGLGSFGFILVWLSQCPGYTRWDPCSNCGTSRQGFLLFWDSGISSRSNRQLLSSNMLFLLGLAGTRSGRLGLVSRSHSISMQEIFLHMLHHLPQLISLSCFWGDGP